ncbi:MAG: low molecular weight protein-tyrosine-phosphatase [Pseudomonadota bacterium]
MRQQLRVLFVCLGNICRSPLAEAIFRTVAPDMECDSAGTSDWHAGEAPSEPMQAIARAKGYTMSDIRSRQLKSEDFRRFDLIIAMDAQNVVNLEAVRPDGNGTPVKLMTDYIADNGINYVPDPYYTGDYMGAFELIEEAVQRLHADL